MTGNPGIPRPLLQNSTGPPTPDTALFLHPSATSELPLTLLGVTVLMPVEVFV